jgi:hypothetical protein
MSFLRTEIIERGLTLDDRGYYQRLRFGLLVATAVIAALILLFLFIRYPLSLLF